jgi:plasmid maintenance system antidote protein VapI
VKQLISSEQLVTKLRKLAADSSLKEAAKALGISPQYLHDVINGRRKVSEKLGAKLGYEMVVKWKATEAK